MELSHKYPFVLASLVYTPQKPQILTVLALEDEKATLKWRHSKSLIQLIALAPNGKWLAISSFRMKGREHHILIDIEQKKPIYSFPKKPEIRLHPMFSFSPDSKQIATYSTEEDMRRQMLVYEVERLLDADDEYL